MNVVYEKLNRIYEQAAKRISFKPELALILGSGLGEFCDTMDIKETLEYGELEDFPVSTVTGHKGRFVFGYAGGVPIVAMQGRVHYYEGYSMSDVVLPVRLMKLMGAEILFLTNAAGGVNLDYQPGDLMLIRDHISVLVPSPLIGPNINALGPRFCDMSDTYDAALGSVIRKTAEALGISIQEGVYMQFTGPQYETPAEIRMARTLGADAVGMSTACEAVAANHMGMHICGISCITNMAAGVTDQPLSHEEVQEMADRTAPLFKKLVTESIIALAAAL